MKKSHFPDKYTCMSLKEAWWRQKWDYWWYWNDLVDTNGKNELLKAVEIEDWRISVAPTLMEMVDFINKQELKEWYLHLEDCYESQDDIPEQLAKSIVSILECF